MTSILIKLQEDINKTTLNHIKEFNKIHLYNHSKIIQPEILDLIKNTIQTETQMFFYCFTIEQYQQCIQNSITPHLCFLGTNILHSPLLNIKEPFERFLIIDNQLMSYNFDLLQSFLIHLNQPICFTIGEPFNPTVEHENARIFIKKIHNKFNNPITYIETNLSTPLLSQNNQILFFKNGEAIILPLILGVFGDYIVEDNNYKTLNRITLLKNKECNICPQINKCQDRGIGLIIHKQKLQGCFSTPLLN